LPKDRYFKSSASACVDDDDLSTQAASSDCASSSGSDDEADHGFCRLTRRQSCGISMGSMDCVIQRDLLLCMRAAKTVAFVGGLRAEAVPDTAAPDVLVATTKVTQQDERWATLRSIEFSDVRHEALVRQSPAEDDLKWRTVRATTAPFAGRTPPGLDHAGGEMPSFDLDLANARWRLAIGGGGSESCSWRVASPSLEQEPSGVTEVLDIQASKKGSLTGALSGCLGGGALRLSGRLSSGLGAQSLSLRPARKL